jgi:hypothetical protein
MAEGTCSLMWVARATPGLFLGERFFKGAYEVSFIITFRLPKTNLLTGLGYSGQENKFKNNSDFW